MKKIVALIMALMMAFAFCAMAETEDGGRTIAPYYFDMGEGGQLYYENLIFNQDVIISGISSQIVFANCQFNGNIINTAEDGTRALLLGCEVNGVCILDNAVEEATFEDPFPKFMTDTPIDVVTTGTFGAVITLGDIEVTFNDETYTLADADIFFDANNPDAGFVPYEGQEVNVMCVAQWTENGEVTKLVECEFDPTL